MIIGQVNALREAVVPVQLRGAAGQLINIQATVDTGFSDELTLPRTLISALQLTYDSTAPYTLGDNSTVVFDVYQAMLIWDGQPRSAFVLEAEGGPLIGMSLLHGYHLFVDVIDGGAVRIQARP